jgi:hypothetical protein
MQISSAPKANNTFLDMFNANSIIARQDKITVDGESKSVPKNVKDRAVINNISSAKKIEQYAEENSKRANGSYSNLKPKF